MNVTLRGKKYKVVRPRKMDDDDLGSCDPPFLPHPKIKILDGQRGINLLCIALHEALHACQWDLSEDAVEEISADLAKFIHDLGFREMPLTK